MKTLTVAALAAVCLLAVSAEAEPEADHTYLGGNSAVVVHNGFSAGFGSQYGGYSGHGGYNPYGREKRSADLSRYGYGNFYNPVSYSSPVQTSYGSSGRWKRSADPEAEAELGYPGGFVGRHHSVGNNFGYQGSGYGSSYGYGR